MTLMDIVLDHENMRITYDKEADAVYIYLLKDEELKPAWVHFTYPCDPVETKAMINLDFNQDHVLGGIEIMNASEILPNSILDSAERI
ncbi:MAG TPA: DUF2283 domain-containing protein [Candidatus Doudnabacteria bacterium]|nr:DUF2283 domain-containing protein [Candidatus Doudnabacteria bacterium]